jgi:threonine/homoserine/homoserine lactone efflux protein
MGSLLPSLLGFAVAMYITPGPNNVMVACSAANYGLRATIPHMLGIAVGFALMLALVSAGLGSAILFWPPLLLIMRWIGVTWIMWLAWKIASAPPPDVGRQARLLGFMGAMAFQWINPKAWFIGLGAASMFIMPDRSLTPQLLRLSLVFLACAMPCLLVWALIGSGSGRLLHSPGRLRAFNLTMAGLLVLSVIPVLIEE